MKAEPSRIVLDTNFLIYCAKYRINFFDELEDHRLFMISPVVEELKEMAKRRGANATAAKLALKMVDSLDVMHSDLKADDALVEFAKDGYGIATEDAGLRKRLKRFKVLIAVVRQKRFVEFL